MAPGWCATFATTSAFPFAGKRVLLMGAGGAARGVMLPLLEQKPALLDHRQPHGGQGASNWRSMFAASRRHVDGGDYASLAGRQFDLVINATSSSLSDELPPLPPGVFAPGAWPTT